MSLYRVEVEGSCREVYDVYANSAEEAMMRWAEGHHVITEVIDAEPVSAELAEDLT